MNRTAIALTLIATYFVASCSSSDNKPVLDDGGTTNGEGTIGSENICHGDKPVNIDGYFDSIYSPRSLVFDPNENEKFDFFKDAEHIDSFIDYRIGVGATYNLGNTSVSTELSKFGNRILRATCLPPGRYSVGPVLTSLTITANLPIGETYPTGSELSGAFSIAPIERGDDANYPPTQALVPNVVSATTEYSSLSEFLQMEPLAPVAFLLRLETRPTSSDEHIFTITYTLSTGLSGSVQVPGVLFQ